MLSKRAVSHPNHHPSPPNTDISDFTRSSNLNIIFSNLIVASTFLFASSLADPVILDANQRYPEQGQCWAFKCSFPTPPNAFPNEVNTRHSHTMAANWTVIASK
jgi:hypothetical protein